MHRSNHRVLCTIAGFDPTGGAGVGVDRAVFEAFGATARVVVTVETDQGPDGVRRLGARNPAVIAEELDAVLLDDDPAAIKIGALGTLEIAQAVARVLDDGNVRPVVLDPVLAASAGGYLLDPAAVPHLGPTLGRVVDVLTPNLPEAEALLGPECEQLLAEEAARSHASDPRAALAAAICKQFWEAVFLKGGHGPADEGIHDVLAQDGGSIAWFERPRLDGHEVRGTGCALSAAIAAYMGEGVPVWTACERAGRWIHALIAEAHAAGRRTLEPAAVPLPSREPQE